jgi:hypothetical protein
MSSKRSKRNTKNFKKLKRKERQDLRAGGRVGKQRGGRYSTHGPGKRLPPVYELNPDSTETLVYPGGTATYGDYYNNEKDYDIPIDETPTDDSGLPPDNVSENTVPEDNTGGSPPADLNIVDDSAQQLPVMTGGQSGPTFDQLPAEDQELLSDINTGEGAKNTSTANKATDKESDLSEDKMQEIREGRDAVASGDVFTRDEEDTITDDRFRTAATVEQETGITPDEDIEKLDENFTKAEAGTATAPTATTVTEGDVTTGSEFGIPAGYSTSPPEGGPVRTYSRGRVRPRPYSPTDTPPEGKIFVYNQKTGARIAIDKPMEAATYTASTIAEGDKPATVAAQFEGDPTKAELDLGDRTVSTDAAERDPEQEEAAKADTTTFEEDARSQVAEVTFRDGVEVTPTPEAEKQNRKIITEEPAPDGVEAVIINNLGYEAVQRRTIKGEAAKGAAANMVAAVGDLPKDVSAAIVEDPAVVEAKIDLQPV